MASKATGSGSLLPELTARGQGPSKGILSGGTPPDKQARLDSEFRVLMDARRFVPPCPS